MYVEYIAADVRTAHVCRCKNIKQQDFFLNKKKQTLERAMDNGQITILDRQRLVFLPKW